ncbi:Uncharacterized protein APZ42_019711 [Daphnia magna]|uniref:Uncharacterized protein n=1 Tax=Daphnia magna TaxID=35525 RepID=A0A164Y4A1_9CRUS|nr:Uncharacterized protein APZ42_019711 [Daphnia magna]
MHKRNVKTNLKKNEIRKVSFVKCSGRFPLRLSSSHKSLSSSSFGMEIFFYRSRRH